MSEHSKQDLQYAAQFREGIHREALKKVNAVYPDADHVVDKYPADAYFQEVWDEDMTDEAVEVFASEANNREQRRAKKAQREKMRTAHEEHNG